MRYELACAAELMRTYNGWLPADFARFQNMMLTVFYPLNHSFIASHNGACISHYWANWDLCNMTSILAIGVLCDDRAKFNEAVNYFYTGLGTGSIGNAVYYIHPGDLGQLEESGRDQGHSDLDIAVLGPFCEIAWNQGLDLYGYAGNRFLAGSEYFADYNLSNSVPPHYTNTVPYVTFNNCDNVDQTVISTNSRGDLRPCWETWFTTTTTTVAAWPPTSPARYAAEVPPRRRRRQLWPQ